MKTLNNPIIGVLITIAIIAGVIFKILHWPGAGPLILVGASSLALYILVLTGIMKFKLLSTEEQLSIFGSKLKLLGISLSVLIIGLLFKIMHWPGAGPQMITGITSFTLISIFYIYSFISKKEPITIKPEVILIAISMLVLVYGVSVGGSSFSLLRNVTSNALLLEHNTAQIIENNKSISKEKLNNKEIETIEATERINEYITSLKVELYQRVDQLPKEMADTISLDQIMGKDNYDMPTLVLGLSNPINPQEGEFTATELKDEIEKFNSIISQFDKEINLENNTHMYGNYEDCWETSMFYHYTLSQVILTLNQIQLEANIICNTILTDNLLKETNTQQPDSIN
jgi:hypothetical protein